MHQPRDALLLRFHIRQESNRDRAAAGAVTGGGDVGGWPEQLPVSVEWPTQKRRKQLQIGAKNAVEVICYSTTPLGMASIQPCCLSLQKRVVKEAEARVKELEKQISSHLGTESIWMLLLACPKAFGRLLPSSGYLDSLAREKAMVVNLGFIKAIVIAEEVLLLDPLQHEVLPFVDQLRQQLLTKARSKGHFMAMRILYRISLVNVLMWVILRLVRGSWYKGFQVLLSTKAEGFRGLHQGFGLAAMTQS
ncbi:hypothetical protein Vadar_026105 [Vaccinium darrowii]|uniref:Uncharacterized protein n=1 Tax=Vaccinium darrowii TaxID=229202 RepID=A0ACB7Z0I7_9ERIC|nr:hypothetical protein Vadar_026105 [Vaccinium darrowii]